MGKTARSPNPTLRGSFFFAGVRARALAYRRSFRDETHSVVVWVVFVVGWVQTTGTRTRPTTTRRPSWPSAASSRTTTRTSSSPSLGLAPSCPTARSPTHLPWCGLRACSAARVGRWLWLTPPCLPRAERQPRRPLRQGRRGHSDGLPLELQVCRPVGCVRFIPAQWPARVFGKFYSRRDRSLAGQARRALPPSSSASQRTRRKT